MGGDWRVFLGRELGGGGGWGWIGMWLGEGRTGVVGTWRGRCLGRGLGFWFRDWGIKRVF